MEEIYLSELIKYYIKRIYIIIIIVVLSFLGGKAYLNKQIPMYNSVSKIFISSIPEDTKVLEDEEPIVDLTMFNVYKDILLSEENLKYSLIESKVNLKYSDIKGNVRIKANEGSANIFTISVDAHKKTDAYELNKSLTEKIVYELNNTYDIKSAKIIENSVMPDAPYNISNKKNLIKIIFIAFFGSIVIIFIKFYFDDTIKSKNGLKNYNLLGDMPKKDSKKFMDKINLIKSKALLGSDAKVILITSVNKNSNVRLLTQSLAKECSINNKVLYINGNLRNERHSEPGYSNLIENYSKKNDIDNYIKLKNGIYVLNNGTSTDDPIAILSNNNNVTLINDLKEKFDYIFIETTDLKDKSDPLVLSKIVDNTIVMVEQNKTKMEDLLETEKSFKQIGSEINGIVFNTEK